MNKFRNSIIIIHDYEYENIKKIHEEANRFWTQYYDNLIYSAPQIVSPIMTTASEKEYTFFINGHCFGDPDMTELFEQHRTRKSWCDLIYKDYLPQNITIVNLGDDGESYIEYQLPKIEV